MSDAILAAGSFLLDRIRSKDGAKRHRHGKKINLLFFNE